MMSRRAAIAAVSLVVLGAAMGVLADRLWIAHHRHTAHIVMDDGHGARFHAMLDSLDLNDSQRVAIDGILRHFQGNVDRTWASLQPRVDSTLDSARRAIEAVFDEEQLAAFRAWLDVERARLPRHPGLRH